MPAFNRDDWKALGGKSRQYLNERTGEVLSRRQFDKLAGRLPQGSYEKKAAANKAAAPGVAAARPARGRRSALSLSKTLNKEQTAAAVKRYAGSKALDRSHYATFNPRTRSYGTATITRHHPMLAGEADDGDDGRAIDEAIAIVATVEAIATRFKTMRGVESYRINVVTAQGAGQFASAVNWDHGLILAGDLPNLNKLFDLLTEGETNNSSAGPVVFLEISAHFKQAEAIKNYKKSEPARIKYAEKQKAKQNKSKGKKK